MHKMMRFGHNAMMMQGGRQMMMNGGRNGGRMMMKNARGGMMNRDDVDNQDVSNMPYTDESTQPGEAMPAEAVSGSTQSIGAAK